MSGRAGRVHGGSSALAALIVAALMLATGCTPDGGEGATSADQGDEAAAPGGGGVSASSPGGAQIPGAGRFLIITDIHFDPFADPAVARQLAQAPVEGWPAILDSASSGSFAQYGSDSNWALMKSALSAAREVAPVYDFVLYAGDYLSHDFNSDYQSYVGGGSEGLSDFVIKTMRFVGQELNRRFPEAPLFGTLGNNDAICGDYMIAPESPMLAAIAEQWGQLAGNPAAFENFHIGGFYALPHPAVPDHDLVVLNSIFWSSRYADQCGPPGTDAGAMQLAWLHWQLARARLEGRSVSLLMHVPPGINAYSSRTGPVCTRSPTPFMAEEYAEPLLDLLESFSDILRNGFAGHTHMDSFRLSSKDDGTPFLATRITPAVSPIFGNNPAFAVVEYDPFTGAQSDYDVYYLTNLPDVGQGDPPDWEVEYDFDDTYEEMGFGPEQARSVAQKIQNDSTYRAAFLEYYDASNPGSSPANEQNWKVFACAQTALTAEAFTQCTCGG